MTIDRIKSLQQKHAHLEKKLHTEMIRPWPNEKAIRDLKKQKLQLRDEISHQLPLNAAA